MNKQQREAIAENLAAIVRRHGGTPVIGSEFDGPRELRFEAHFPEVSVSMDIDDTFNGGILASWYGAKRNLHWRAFDSVNECHFRKATQYRPTAEDFAAAFDRTCGMVADGSAFQ